MPKGNELRHEELLRPVGGRARIVKEWDKHLITYHVDDEGNATIIYDRKGHTKQSNISIWMVPDGEAIPCSPFSFLPSGHN